MISIITRVVVGLVRNVWNDRSWLSSIAEIRTINNKQGPQINQNKQQYSERGCTLLLLWQTIVVFGYIQKRWFRKNTWNIFNSISFCLSVLRINCHPGQHSRNLTHSGGGTNTLMRIFQINFLLKSLEKHLKISNQFEMFWTFQSWK